MRWVFGGLVIGAATGALIGGIPGAVVGGLAAGFAAAGLGPLSIRPIIIIPVVAGSLAGGLVGANIVRILCRDTAGGCPVWQLIAGVLTAVGAAVGIGIVVSLATRSLDEYHEAAASGRTPPDPGCETGDPASDDER